ncbi:MAG: MBL fold metallo-hydrolase [Oscillospiraceae bacterium]|nr:MBL fold metallo-hydrolase [Oscillospiraceae bacterium]
MNDWFTIQQVDESTHIISEYRHWEETHCYLLRGTERALLIDTGLGIGNIREEAEKLTDLPIVAAATHIHWDHIGGHRHFPEFYAHGAELNWLSGEFPLPTDAVREMLCRDCDLPEGFDGKGYELFRGTPARVLKHGDVIDLGGRSVYVLHTPGHSPGHLCFWEPARGYLFVGDLVYRGTLAVHYPSTNPKAYLRSLEKIAALPAKRVFPGHHDLDIPPEFVTEVRDAFLELQAEGVLHHDSGRFDYDGWAIQL